MRAVRFLAAVVPTALIVSALALAAAGPASPASAGTLAATAAAAGSGRAAGSAAAGSDGCHRIFHPPDSWVVVCSAGGGTGGAPGSGGGTGGGGGGGGGGPTCMLTPLSKAQQQFLGLPKAPKGEEWAAVQCPGKQPFGGVTLVSTAAGAPPVTPQEVLAIVEGLFRVPVLKAQTAPPIGHDGLVGLPEWYWIPRGYAPAHLTKTVGGVSATITATPEGLTFDPGGGLAASTCAGPGVPYSAAASARRACTYTYDQSSATQAGGAYAASVTVNWRVSWHGTGIPDTFLRNVAIPDDLSLKVAEGQALVTGGGQ
jgi:hypothetical protein